MKEALVPLLRKQPFQPFEVRMSNGDAYQVRHPEMALLLKSNLVFGSPESDKFTFCALLHITGVHSMDTGLRPSE